ncbi:hypothetical protein ANCDUO_22776 [Ancylostoma duodenale]|uniref:Uncharacterized protein n=1 Tax=Ancylostoma duodenale TaxID=51022 RepID=A0A0C2CBD7_9BILA|nr:hypothetical protein ANCDUO_22776 [Ancylostoma duodenale]
MRHHSPSVVCWIKESIAVSTVATSDMAVCIYYRLGCDLDSLVELSHIILLSASNREKCAQDEDSLGVQRFFNEPRLDAVLEREAATPGGKRDTLHNSQGPCSRIPRQTPPKDADGMKCERHVT